MTRAPFIRVDSFVTLNASVGCGGRGWCHASNELGNERFYGILEEAIHEHFPRLDPAALRQQFPSFQEIDAEDMAASFG